MPVVIGEKYQLMSPEGIGIGYGKLDQGIFVDVQDILPPGERPNPSEVEGYVVFLYLDARTPSGESIERLIGYGEAFFAEHFSLYVPPPVEPDPGPDPESDPVTPPETVPGSGTEETGEPPVVIE
ncbi:hypothetical protein ACIOEX_29330 [Streptomyces sp. NPDC087850]|uniref:hypothetical protein n=1 Tax=Streptomyces sp. NPDC087850 TaxID=3365809 RepID=UPI003801A8B6